MDIVVKPTYACNFKCDFCAACSGKKPTAYLPIKAIVEEVEQVGSVDEIIVNGGDPLMLPPSYYESLLEELSKKGLNPVLSLTTNLYDFYLRPDRWISLFRKEQVRVCTSFQYGGGRRLANGKEYTEEMFRKVFDRYKEKTGEPVMFISVISEENEAKAMKTVELAKELGTMCRLNPLEHSGRSKNYYPLYKMYSIYLDIIDKGWQKYDMGTTSFIDCLMGKQEQCPHGRNSCLQNIRTIEATGVVHTCPSISDDIGDRMFKTQQEEQKEIVKKGFAIKPQCFNCDLFRLCNGCYKYVIDVHSAHDESKHCMGMMAMYDRIREAKAKLENSVY